MSVSDFLDLFESLHVIVIPKDWKFHTSKTEFMHVKDTLKASYKYFMYRSESRRDLINSTTTNSEDHDDPTFIFGAHHGHAAETAVLDANNENKNVQFQGGNPTMIPTFLRKPTADDCLVPAAVAKSISGKHNNAPNAGVTPGKGKLPSEAHHKAAIHLARLPSIGSITSESSSSATDGGKSSESGGRGNARKRADTLAPDVYAVLLPSSSPSKGHNKADTKAQAGLESLAEEGEADGKARDGSSENHAYHSTGSALFLHGDSKALHSDVPMLSHSESVDGNLPVHITVDSHRKDPGPSVDSSSESQLNAPKELTPRNTSREEVLGEYAATYVEPEVPKSTSRKLPRVRRSTFVF